LFLGLEVFQNPTQTQPKPQKIGKRDSLKEDERTIEDEESRETIIGKYF
jgi:hypothetical protein